MAQGVEPLGRDRGSHRVDRASQFEVQVDVVGQAAAGRPAGHRGDVVPGVADHLHRPNRHARGRGQPVEQVGVVGQAQRRPAALLVTHDREPPVAALPLVGHRVDVAAAGHVPGLDPLALAPHQQGDQLVAPEPGGHVLEKVGLVGDHDVGVGVEQRPDEAVAGPGMPHEHDGRAQGLGVGPQPPPERRRSQVRPGIVARHGQRPHLDHDRRAAPAGCPPPRRVAHRPPMGKTLRRAGRTMATGAAWGPWSGARST